MNKNRIKAFTLIEILVVIAIVSILVLGASKINFNTISDKQKLDRNIIKIISQIETVRNNSLLGKGIGVNLDVPNKYELHFSKTGSGEIKLFYNTGGTDIEYSFENKISFGNDFEFISSLKCLDIKKDSANTKDIITGTGKIIIEGPNLTLTGACDKPEHKILQLTINRKQFYKTIEINTINGLIEVK